MTGSFYYASFSPVLDRLQTSLFIYYQIIFSGASHVPPKILVILNNVFLC